MIHFTRKQQCAAPQPNFSTILLILRSQYVSLYYFKTYIKKYILVADKNSPFEILFEKCVKPAHNFWISNNDKMISYVFK